MLEELLEMGYTIKYLGRRTYAKKDYLFILCREAEVYSKSADTLDEVLKIMYNDVMMKGD